PGLSAQLLRLVNSAGFSLRQRCTTVRHAVTIVGSKHLYRIATTAAVLDLFDAESEEAVVVLRHSAAMGALCRYLGAHLGMSAEELFTMGALHDIGKLMMLEAFGEPYRALMERCEGHADRLHSFERAEFGFDHGVLAGHVLKAWDIPQPIPKIVAWHHEPARAYESSSAHAAQVQVLRFADALAHTLDAPATREEVALLAKHEGAAYLDISEAQLGVMWNEIVEIHARAVDPEGRAAEPGAAPRPAAAPALAEPTPIVPKGYACIECNSPTFGATCPACKADLCPEHPPGPLGWCSLCSAEFAALGRRAPFPLDGERGIAVIAALVFALTLALWRAAQPEGVVGGVVAGALLATLAGVLVAIGRRSYLRARFLRGRSPRIRREAAKLSVS
ncbi:MAG TPA: HDOD domain-containing protein, partial [Polyangiaceae bacterium]